MDSTLFKLFNRISTLTENNWQAWKWKCELALRQLNLWSILIDDSDLTRGNSVSDDLIRTLIGIWVDDSLVYLIKDCESAAQMWKNLNEYFENNKKRLFQKTMINSRKPQITIDQNTSKEPETNKPETNQNKEKKKEIKCGWCNKFGHQEKKCFRKRRLLDKLRKANFLCNDTFFTNNDTASNEFVCW